MMAHVYLVNCARAFLRYEQPDSAWICCVVTDFYSNGFFLSCRIDRRRAACIYLQHSRSQKSGYGAHPPIENLMPLVHNHLPCLSTPRVRFAHSCRPRYMQQRLDRPFLVALHTQYCPWFLSCKTIRCVERSISTMHVAATPPPTRSSRGLMMNPVDP